MSPHSILAAALLLALPLAATAATEVRTDQPRVAPDAIVAEERAGFVIVEGEDFFQQTNTKLRAWHLTDATHLPSVGNDIDPPNFATASGAAYIEVLPDEGVDGAPVIKSVTLSDVPGEMAVASYRVKFNTPGRYTIWTRAFGTDGDDNTLHYGLDGTWPESSARSHTFGGKKWAWANRNRKHKGKVFFDVPTAGTHVVTISMREDGCDLDQFILTTDESFSPPAGIADATTHAASLALPLAERAGLLVVEIEHAKPATGWAFVSEIGTGTGRGFFRWTLPGQGKKATDDSVLSYTFQITTPGTYQFFLRSQMPDPTSRLDTLDPDGNDIWLRFIGGTDAPGQAALGESKWTKIAILGHPAGWTWNIHADRGPPHPDTPVCRVFEKPGLYRLEFAGRSQGHAIDRFVLQHLKADPRLRLTPDEEKALDALPASPRE